MTMQGANIRQTLLEVVDETYRMTLESSVPTSMEQDPILNETVKRLGGSMTTDDGRALLVQCHDIFRVGLLCWGYDLTNPDPQSCHVTLQGRRALAHVSRDPSNPDGYLAYLATRSRLNTVASSYV